MRKDWSHWTPTQYFNVLIEGKMLKVNGKMLKRKMVKREKAKGKILKGEFHVFFTFSEFQSMGFNKQTSRYTNF